ncbi:hypothetical protein AJ79_01920 [Helicocarpus griseus UAMH5409]|uniref:Mis18 domain-containing protein n=1 Tax=Helicocarpus griseus UAMH5409 TaxID=1447875 RepID=A0A2B7Y570_9EURO|nr:hypothetical protein AJ79_01920 [Helicocarpus griseus UAMH5409]
MAANPIIASTASLLVPWESSSTVTCHCYKCDALLAIAENTWISRYPYLTTPGSLCVFDNNIFSEPLPQPQPAEDGEHQTILCKQCLEIVGHGVQSGTYKNGFPQFQFLWLSKKIHMRDITTRELVPLRIDGAINNAPPALLKNIGPVSMGRNTPINGPAVAQYVERHDLDMPEVTPNGVHPMDTDLRKAVNFLHDEVRRLTAAINNPQVPSDAYELMATAWREVRAKGIEIEALKRENDALRIKSKPLASASFVRVERTPGMDDGYYGAFPGSAQRSAPLDRREYPTILNTNGKRPREQDIPLSTSDENSQLNVAKAQPATVEENPLGTAISQHRDTVSTPDGIHLEAANSDVDELSQQWRAPNNLRSLRNGTRGKTKIPLSYASDTLRASDQRQDHEPAQTPQKKTTKPKTHKRKNFTTKKLRGRPKSKSLPATTSATKVPLRDQDIVTVTAATSADTNEHSQSAAADAPPPQDKPGPKKPRRSSSRLSRRSSVAPQEHANAQNGPEPDATPAQSEQHSALQPQFAELQGHLPLPTAHVEIFSRTIRNSQSDDDGGPLDQEDTQNSTDKHAGEELIQKASQLRHPRDPIDGKRKSQIASRDTLAKLAMQREEALEAAAQ